MKTFLIVLACLLAGAWLPIVRKFQLSWRARKNPVSLAIATTVLLLTYSHVVFILAMMGETTWWFVAVAIHVFETAIVTHFYVALWLANRKFAGGRRTDTVLPPNTESTRLRV